MKLFLFSMSSNLYHPNRIYLGCKWCIGFIPAFFTRTRVTCIKKKRKEMKKYFRKEQKFLYAKQ